MGEVIKVNFSDGRPVPIMGDDGEFFFFDDIPSPLEESDYERMKLKEIEELFGGGINVGLHYPTPRGYDG